MNESKTARILQTLYKIGRIVSKIAFICCIIGFCGCLIGIVVMALCAGSVKVDGVALSEMIKESSGFGMAAVYAAAAAGAVTCAAQAVVSRFAALYCKNELADGDPFTLRGAKELMRLGILTAVLPLAATILCGVAAGIAEPFFPGVKDALTEETGCVGLGLGLIVLSLFCRRGAEKAQDEPTETV